MKIKAEEAEPDVRVVLDAAAPALRAQGAPTERARDWQNCEQIDFNVTAATGQDGITWIWLNCSACGHVAATAQGEPSDLGGMSVMAQSHLERKHADLLDGDDG